MLTRAAIAAPTMAWRAVWDHISILGRRVFRSLTLVTDIAY